MAIEKHFSSVISRRQNKYFKRSLRLYNMIQIFEKINHEKCNLRKDKLKTFYFFAVFEFYETNRLLQTLEFEYFHLC